MTPWQVACVLAIGCVAATLGAAVAEPAATQAACYVALANDPTPLLGVERAVVGSSADCGAVDGPRTAASGRWAPPV